MFLLRIKCGLVEHIITTVFGYTDLLIQLATSPTTVKLYFGQPKSNFISVLIFSEVYISNMYVTYIMYVGKISLPSYHYIKTINTTYQLHRYHQQTSKYFSYTLTQNKNSNSVNQIMWYGPKNIN